MMLLQDAISSPLGPDDTTAFHAGDALPALADDSGRAAWCPTPVDAAHLDALHVESLVLNLDSSVRIHSRAHLFSWTQGLLQCLVKHEALICVQRTGDALTFRGDSFSTAVADPRVFSDLLVRDASVAPTLARTWRERHFEPFVVDAGDSSVVPGELARELERTGAQRIIGHGTCDGGGEVVSLFLFACQAEAVGPVQPYLVQLIVPALHAAWIRSQLGEVRAGARLAPERGNVLTVREREILRWIYLGKSNGEIGSILGISALTVKNHVQKVLRKLNVVNRTQAVGKALDARLINS